MTVVISWAKDIEKNKQPIIIKVIFFMSIIKLAKVFVTGLKKG